MDAAPRHLVVDRKDRDEKGAGGEPEALEHALRRRHATDQVARQVQERLESQRHKREHHEALVNLGAVPEQQPGRYAPASCRRARRRLATSSWRRTWSAIPAAAIRCGMRLEESSHAATLL